MPQLSGVYDAYLVQPVAKIKQNVSMFRGQGWDHYRVEYEEMIPPGPASVVDMVAQATLTAIAAGQILPVRGVPFLILGPTEMFQLRFRVLDDIEALLWEPTGTGRYNSMNLRARVDRFLPLLDPYYATTQFWLMTPNTANVMGIEVRNNTQVALPAARLQFWGVRYVVQNWLAILGEIPEADKTALKQGEAEAVRKYVGETTWIVGAGLQA